MSLFALLWGKLLRSSLWVKESKETRLVWVTLLAMKDEDGRVYSSVVGLADAAKVSLEECKEALRILLAPDEDDTSKVEEGRRIREVVGGWEIVNNDLYRYSSDEKRDFWRKQKALQRAIKSGGALDPETLTDDQLKVWKAAKAKELKRRTKLVEREGSISGATEAVNNGLAEAEAKMRREERAADGIATEGGGIQGDYSTPHETKEICHAGQDGVCRWAMCPLRETYESQPERECPLTERGGDL